MSTITKEQQQAIADWVTIHELPSGLGTKEAACSIAAINLALTGELTDKIPDCMSKVIGRWVIRVQDALPHSIRNSNEWKLLLPLAAGTGRDKEIERQVLILNWMGDKVLPAIQHVANSGGFGPEWLEMCKQKTPESARKAKRAAKRAAAAAADAVTAAHAAHAAKLGFWQKVDPCGLLAKLIEI